MKKKILGLLLLVTLMFTSPVLAEDTALISNQGVNLNGQIVELAAYNIKDENYFKLRDLAAILKGSPKEFNVSYDPYIQSVIVETNSTYEILPTDLMALTQNNQLAIPNIHGFFLNGSMEDIKSYNIVDNNYYRLRDLGKMLDFGVAYDYNTNNVIIDTNNPNIQDVQLRQGPREPARGYVPVDIPNTTARTYEQLLDIAELHLMNMDDNFSIMVDIPGFNNYNYNEALDYIFDEIYFRKGYNLHLTGNIDYINSYVWWNGYGQIYQVDFQITYGINKDERQTLYMQVQNWVRDNIDPSMSDETKVRLIHDYIVANNDYDMVSQNGSGVNKQSPYAMLHGGGVCEAYAGYFALLATEAGLDHRFVLGSTYGDLSTSGLTYDQAVETLYTREYEHIWNQVKVNGTWYNIDTTWDDPLYGDYYYKYYLVADEVFYPSHVWDLNMTYPVPYSYYPRPN